MEKGVKTRDRILRAAYQLFLRKGYSDVSLSELVNAAGLTKGGFYHHFESKDELFAEVVDRYLLAFYRELREKLLNAEGNTREKLEALCGEVCSLPAQLLEGEKKELKFGYYILIFQGIKHYPQFVEKLSDIYCRMRGAVADILRQGVERGEIRQDLDCKAAAFQIIAQAEGGLLMWTMDKSIDLNKFNRKSFENIWSSISA